MADASASLLPRIFGDYSAFLTCKLSFAPDSGEEESIDQGISKMGKVTPNIYIQRPSKPIHRNVVALPWGHWLNPTQLLIA